MFGAEELGLESVDLFFKRETPDIDEFEELIHGVVLLDITGSESDVSVALENDSHVVDNEPVVAITQHQHSLSDTDKDLCVLNGAGWIEWQCHIHLLPGPVLHVDREHTGA